MLVFALASLIALQQIPQARQTPPIQQQDKAKEDAKKGTQQQQPATPARITVDGPITVVNEPDSNQKQREANQRADTRFEHSVQVWTLVFVAIAAFAAIGAFSRYIHATVDDGISEKQEARYSHCCPKEVFHAFSNNAG